MFKLEQYLGRDRHGREADDRDDEAHPDEQEHQPTGEEALARGGVGPGAGGDGRVNRNGVAYQAFHFGVAPWRAELEVAGAAWAASGLAAAEQGAVIAARHASPRQQPVIQGFHIAEHSGDQGYHGFRPVQRGKAKIANSNRGRFAYFTLCLLARARCSLWMRRVQRPRPLTPAAGSPAVTHQPSIARTLRLRWRRSPSRSR